MHGVINELRHESSNDYLNLTLHGSMISFRTMPVSLDNSLDEERSGNQEMYCGLELVGVGLVDGNAIAYQEVLALL